MMATLMKLLLPWVLFACVPAEQNWNGSFLVNELCSSFSNATATIAQQEVSKAIAETLRAVAAERGDKHCRGYASWNYRFIQSGTRPSDCSSQPIGNRTSIKVLPVSRLSVLQQFAGRGNLDNAVPENTTVEIVDVTTTLAPQLKFVTSPLMQPFNAPTSTLMRREGGVKIIADSVHRNQQQQPGDDAVAAASSAAAASHKAFEPKLLLRRETTDAVSFKEHLDLLMNVLQSAALIVFLCSAFKSLGVGVFKLLTSSTENERTSVVDAAEHPITN